MINIALPKGRLGDSVYCSLARIGYECPEMLTDSRKLVFENSEKGVRYILFAGVLHFKIHGSCGHCLQGRTVGR